MMDASSNPPRVDWVDIAKALCITLVVAMHATGGVEHALGQTSWMGLLVEWARPFRIPAFFLVAGLFLARTIDAPWRRFLDGKLVHFAYFYLLWAGVQIAAKSGLSVDVFVGRYLEALTEPLGSLWFIVMLPAFYLTTRALKALPAYVLLALAAALEIGPVATGHFMVDEFAGRYVYFVIGYTCAPLVFRLADEARAAPKSALLWLAAWAAVHTMAVVVGISGLPLVSLAVGVAGAAALVAGAALLAETRIAAALRDLGARSIAVYLAFFLPMAAMRALIVGSGLALDVGLAALIVTIAAVSVPLVLERAVRDGPFAFLFQRPAWMSIAPPRTRRPTLQAAE